MTKIAIANWKMNLSSNEGRKLVFDLSEKLKNEEVEVVICPPFTMMSTVGEMMRDTGFALGAQNCHHESSGAYTGSISVEMLKDIRCTNVIVGHSECRQYNGDTSEQVSQKIKAVIRNGLIPIVCVGENIEIRDSRKHLEFVAKQLDETIPNGIDLAELIVAYEPIWAIGTGRVAGIDDIAEMHTHILSVIKKKLPHNVFRVVYGGSVNAGNCAEILALDMVDGVLVGGASLDAEAFAQIALTAAKA